MNIQKEEALSRHTSFRVGGPARSYLIPESVEELAKLIQEFHQKKAPYLVIGNGSNLLVSDAGVDCAVIEVGKALSGIAVDGTRITAEAGTLLARVAAEAGKLGLSGMEGLRGIPGTVGGACVMNAGAHGDEIKDILEAVDVIAADGTLLHLAAADLALSYRHSCIEEKGWIVVRAYFCLKEAEGGAEAVRARMEALLAERARKQPLDKPSAGSTFKRPAGDFAGRLIEVAGLSGFSIGGAQVSRKHCGFIVNNDDASASDIYALIKEVQARVFAHSGVMLEPEVKLWGKFD